ncbi:DUF5330 domain-containing protein [Mesorhizobium sp. UC22_110]|jgi:hypothetical protein|uniref:DUF5330 domain-containing protein n=1 Tax=unclassified Mesorhizobium TaxID=325217 RepID=UPI00366E0890
MFFLLRAAFWFSLVLLALPFGIGSGEQGRESVNPIQALLAARDAVGDIAGMCERKPDVCETGKAAMHTIGVRAQETARIAADMLDQQPAEQVARPAETVPATDQATITGSVIPTPSARPDPNS